MRYGFLRIAAAVAVSAMALVIATEASAGEPDGYFDRIRISVKKSSYYMPIEVYLQTPNQRCGKWRITDQDVDENTGSSGYLEKDVSHLCSAKELEKVENNKAWVRVKGDPGHKNEFDNACKAQKEYKYRSGVDMAIVVSVSLGYDPRGNRQMQVKCEGLAH